MSLELPHFHVGQVGGDDVSRLAGVVVVVIHPAMLHHYPNHGLINYMDLKAKCRHLKKLTCKGTLRQVFICLRPLPLL